MGLYTADQARHRTNQNNVQAHELEMSKVEGAITSAINKGEYHCLTFINNKCTITELVRNGYVVEKLPEDPRDQRAVNMCKITW